MCIYQERVVLRPARRLLFMIFRPLVVLIRARKPTLRMRLMRLVLRG